MKGDCGNEYDERFYDSGMIPISEFELMDHSGVLPGLDNRYDDENFIKQIVKALFGDDGASKSLENDGLNRSKLENIMKSWNRPTTSWKLECDLQEGKTRKDAVEKSKLQLKMTDHYDHVFNIGIAVIVIYVVLLIFSLILLLFAPELGIYGFIAFTRVLWIIMGPILLTSLEAMRVASFYNKEIIEEMSIINECSDKETKFD